MKYVHIQEQTILCKKQKQLNIKPQMGEEELFFIYQKNSNSQQNHIIVVVATSKPAS
jgi:hypothetical protein